MSIDTYEIIILDVSKMLHRQVAMGIVLKPGSLHGEIVSTLAWNASDMGSITTLTTIFPISITPTVIP